MTKLNDKTLMQRCFDLAKGGRGNVSPNPLVGCVIVHRGTIVGEGFHQRFGGPHAEVYALLHAGAKTRGATLFVNLEPCAHFGKTPPCADAIIHSGIVKVVLAARDPNPLVRGRGIRRLREAGLNVEVGVLRKEAEILNEKFFKFMRTGLPFVGIKLAQTLDGRIADVRGNSKWITSESSRKETHRLRSEYDAVLVGARTVLKDNPELTVRSVKGKNPVRIVVDWSMSLRPSLRIFQTIQAPTWVISSARAMRSNKQKVLKLTSLGVRVFGLSPSPSLQQQEILQTLSREGISSVLVEGGAQTASGFLEHSLADKLHLFVAPKIFGGGLDAIQFHHPKLIHQSIRFKPVKASWIGADLLIEANVHYE